MVLCSDMICFVLSHISHDEHKDQSAPVYAMVDKSKKEKHAEVELPTYQVKYSVCVHCTLDACIYSDLFHGGTAQDFPTPKLSFPFLDFHKIL